MTPQEKRAEDGNFATIILPAAFRADQDHNPRGGARSLPKGVYVFVHGVDPVVKSNGVGAPPVVE